MFFVPRIEAGLALSKLVRRGGLVSKLETGSRILDKNEFRALTAVRQVSKTSVDSSPGAPGITLNEKVFCRASNKCGI
jgi:hypothetical protein